MTIAVQGTEEAKQLLAFLDPDEARAFELLWMKTSHEPLLVLVRALVQHRMDCIEQAGWILDGSMSHTDCASSILQEAEKLQRLLELAKEMR